MVEEFLFAQENNEKTNKRLGQRTDATILFKHTFNEKIHLNESFPCKNCTDNGKTSRNDK